MQDLYHQQYDAGKVAFNRSRRRRCSFGSAARRPTSGWWGLEFEGIGFRVLGFRVYGMVGF